jgi:pimeloyl-ACP methyl ester carboxylesterase
MAPNTFQPIAFGPRERRLFGIYHLTQAAPARPAVVLCNAFGQEAIRAHRFQRALAERLARAGHPVLRFDYFGTGDSMGDDADGDLDGWCDDVRAAHQELQRLSNADRLVWVGMRLGGSVVLRAARDAPPDLAKLILWDPVQDGPRYLAHLRERHIASLEAVYSLPQKPSPRLHAADPANYVDEAIGFALSSKFRSQVSAIALDSHTWPTNPSDIVVLADPDTPDGNDTNTICALMPERVRLIEVRHGTNWTTDTAANTSLVPTAALMGIAQQVGEAR